MLFELPDDQQRVCPSCGGGLQTLDGQFEDSEMVDVVDASYRIVQVRRQKYVCSCKSCLVTAPGPERVIDGGRYSRNFGLKVALDKYLFIVSIVDRLGGEVRLTTRIGEGSTFQLLFPTKEAMPSEGRPAESGPSGDPLKVLYIKDNEGFDCL